MLKAIILVGIGGFIGSVARYLLAIYALKPLGPTTFPWSTFIANIVGCLVIGLVYGLSEKFQWFNIEYRLLLATGICGGFTTFSTFAYENIILIQSNNLIVFALYCVLSIIIGLLFVFIGLSIIKLF